LPIESLPMAEIEIVTENEAGNRWTYHVRVFDGGRKYDHQVTLSWADYDLWCRGRLAPEKVVKAAFAFLLSMEPASAILPRFDCSVIRRYFPEVDQQIGLFLGQV